jgi:hypothetical protein
VNLNPEWLVTPIATYAVTGTGLLALLYLWFSARLEVSKCRKDVSTIKTSTEGALRELASKVQDALSRDVSTRPEEKPVPVCEPTMAVTQSLNLTRRARALHMRARGEGPQTIAAALGISQGEVKLLFNLDRLVRKPAE